MFWADKIAKEIVDSGKYKPYWVDDMKTPSGKIHVGSLRGVVIHDLIYKALINKGQKATFTYCINDLDPMDGFPLNLDVDKFYKYMGVPLFKIPSPEEGFDSFSQYYAQEFIEVFNRIGSHPKVIWTSDLYADGSFDKLIKVYLDNTDKIRDLFKMQYKNFKEKEYYPYQPICPNCGKIATTKIYKWDGEYVYFDCQENISKYTTGCHYKGKIKPEKLNGKLPWKIEWSAHWKTLGVTIEWSGKDHMTAGGSHEIASKVCEEILKYPTPHAESYEHLLLGGRKMSSSKGIGSSAKEVSEILPPHLLRFVFVRVDYRETIDFDPMGTMVIPDLYDEYDRCWQAYNTGSDENLARVFEYSQIDKIPLKNPKLFIPRFREVANYIQHPTLSITDKFRELKGGELTEEEKGILTDREKYARIWIEKYAPDEYKFHMTEKMPEEVKSLNDAQKSYLQKISGLLDKYSNAEDLQLALYNLSKEMKLATKEAFSAIYISFLGKSHGPKAAWFLLQYPKEVVINRLQDASYSSSDPPASGESRSSSRQDGYRTVTRQARTINVISRPDLFTIDPLIKKVYPSVLIGIAVIKNINITKTNNDLEKDRQELLDSLKGLTTEQLGIYREITSYRRLYKDMGIDWHSRRPSPEALLRRIALNKGLYTINTCVDAYNLVVMKHRVSVGAFDADQVEFPTVLRYARQGDEILLLGDSLPTKYSSKEIAYYDKLGGYNIDFNYRDAQRTMVTEKTKNIWINVDGVYDITPKQVEQSLKESIEIILKYCGGEVEFEGVVI